MQSLSFDLLALEFRVGIVEVEDDRALMQLLDEKLRTFTRRGFWVTSMGPLTLPTSAQAKIRTTECREPFDFDLLINNETAAPLLAGRLARDGNSVLGGRTKTSIRKRTDARGGEGPRLSTQPVLV